MRERAAELGGSFVAGPDPGGGGLVVAELPLRDGAGEPSAR
jgi:signal transduction histidine kinase